MCEGKRSKVDIDAKLMCGGLPLARRCDLRVIRNAPKLQPASLDLSKHYKALHDVHAVAFTKV